MSNIEILSYTAVVYGIFITLLAIGTIQCHYNYVREGFVRFIYKSKKNGISIVEERLLEEFLSQKELMRIVSHKTTTIRVLDDIPTSGGISTYHNYHELTWDGYKIICGKNTYYVLLSQNANKLLEVHSQMALWLNDRGKKSIPIGNILERLISSLSNLSEEKEVKCDEHRVFQIWCKNELLAQGNIPLECLLEPNEK